LRLKNKDVVNVLTIWSYEHDWGRLSSSFYGRYWYPSNNSA